MEVFKCRICGDPYVGGSKPSHCPFCGAPSNYIILAHDWQEPEAFELTEVSKADLEHALMLENNNALFYTCAYEVSMNVELSAMFKALAKVEAEHASVIRKLLGLPKPIEEEDNRGRCQALDQGNIKEAHDREKRAIDFYSRAAEVAIEPRIKEVFTALVEIEKTHIELNNKYLGTFSGMQNPII
ncbi:MAG: ferritin [Candidatus Aquicultor secundus]|uniref:Ferritin n=1 Tax=Candidatus Aquicultor secundus TaxID=1973895 RepID=A0A2M7T9Z1_9ACTN|nr:ferritin family protein [Candidatus Aquicultor secundus]NCO65025.1 ferritin [Solirubrobacter sp.]PIU27629.1 MAG: ferritin [Candidatus Aquicultor secundus]PIW22114.1 MAG: ferritin [Candidatus Aquicultor secundus]PIX53126.1 MAG: ferritin [Candidatus Aquicultor secundus]PIY38855.1 MAG: ferritin [Candidatus Aquicultor secundus]